MNSDTILVERMRCPSCKVAQPLPTTPLQLAFPVLQRDATTQRLHWWFRPRGQFAVEPRYLLCACGRDMRYFVVEARESETECGDRCRSATGPACECRCRGENHGAH